MFKIIISPTETVMAVGIKKQLVGEVTPKNVHFGFKGIEPLLGLQIIQF